MNNIEIGSSGVGYVCGMNIFRPMDPARNTREYNAEYTRIQWNADVLSKNKSKFTVTKKNMKNWSRDI